jgi:restriction endonuclease S subunit
MKRAVLTGWCLYRGHSELRYSNLMFKYYLHEFCASNGFKISASATALQVFGNITAYWLNNTEV